ncbi:MAG: hypothetical protein SGJ27_04950 [Candidatus Melainabacteria bacterium]|nr:hypothetical protein [Candidatus Melainabacteria bacterium]
MKLSHSKVKRGGAATNDVAPIPPAELNERSHQLIMPGCSVANSFFSGRRSDLIRRRYTPLAVLVSLLVAINLFAIEPATAQFTEQAAEQPAEQAARPTETRNRGEVSKPHDTTDSAAQLDNFTRAKQQAAENNIREGSAELEREASLAAEVQDAARFKNFSRFLPPQWRTALIQSRKAHRPGPLIVFRQWAQERKPFGATLLFCLFFGLIGTAFFPRQIAVAQERCRSEFWKCLGTSILIGITLLVTVRILNSLLIAHALSTVLIAMLQLAMIAGLSVGVALIGEGLTRGNLAKSNYFLTHPRVATFTKILIGSVIIALIVQIPGAGLLPRIGIRIALLVAILGFGGLLKTKFGTEPTSTR